MVGRLPGRRPCKFKRASNPVSIGSAPAAGQKQVSPKLCGRGDSPQRPGKCSLECRRGHFSRCGAGGDPIQRSRRSILAAGGLDIVANAEKHPLPAVIWAACAKDPGYNPLLLLNQMQRNSRVNPAELREMGARFEPAALKTRWLDLVEVAGKEIQRAAIAGIEPGVAFVSARGEIGWFDLPGYKPHKASLGGALPRLVGIHYGVV